MATLEMVEKLRQRADVSYDEAKAALEACNDDLLEAMIYLEKQGKVKKTDGDGFYSTEQESGFQYAESRSTFQDHNAQNRESFGSAVRRFGRWLLDLLKKSWTNHFEVHRRGELVAAIPVVFLVLLMIFLFWIMLPLLIIGLFFGCRYQFRGPELSDSQVNSAMHTAADTVEDLKRETFHKDQKNNRI